MVLQSFFEFYLDRVDPAVRDRLTSVLPDGVNRDAAGLASMFSRSDMEAMEFLLRFHEELEDIREKDPYNCITFNKSDNVCFPFFIKYIWERLDEAVKQDISAKMGTTDLNEMIFKMQADSEARNWFRKRIAPVLTQEDLFSLNEVIALQNFNSGGEYSFLSLVWPEIKGMRGKFLDGGCGAGFASLMMSQLGDVCGIDACLPRLKRAEGMARIMKNGERQFFQRVLNIIAREMGSLAKEVQFPSAGELLGGKTREIRFDHGSLDTLPYNDNEFDVILCMDVLEHTYDPAKIIAQFGRVAKPGSLVFITAPNAFGEMYQKYAEDHEGAAFPALLHMHHFDDETLNSLFARQGFEPVRTVPFDHIEKQEFIKMVDSKDLEAYANLIEESESIPTQIFAIYKKK